MTSPRRGRPTRVLAAVHDSAASLRAARLAVAVAARAGCPLLVVTVVEDGSLTRALDRAATQPMSEQRRHAAAAAVVRHVDRLADLEGVPVEGRVVTGTPGPSVLAAAHEWGADLVVVGRNESGDGAFGRVGDVALHVLELSDVPVLVVP